MQGFSHRQTVQAALDWLDAQLRVLEAETVSLRAAAGRVLAAAVVSGPRGRPLRALSDEEAAHRVGVVDAPDGLVKFARRAAEFDYLQIFDAPSAA